MTFASMVRSRLRALGYEQKDLARAARVTESYVSQLLTRRKAPPRPDRTDIYLEMETFLELERGELGRLAEIERADQIRRKIGQSPEPLFQEFRDLVLRKCVKAKRKTVREVFEQQPFGTLEQLVATSLLEAVQKIARRELESENWIRLAAQVGGKSDQEMRVIVLEFLDRDVFDVSRESCVAFLEPLVESWDIDLNTLRLDMILNRKLVQKPRRRFAFVEIDDGGPGEEPGLTQFLKDGRLSGDATEEEIGLLRKHSFGGRKPTGLYFYRALQNLRDDLHFKAL